ncbi:MAG: heavy-metal-associated domain-containing protein [Candidatus Rokubacteria bacterium]|nr:heavy-metal-associated domain-containing protein [Candidatus Rokubacteria bacterium]
MARRALAGLPGVQQVAVSFAEGRARIAYDPAEVTVDQMVHAISRVGFRARPIATP